jgi:hypothetical protein
MGLADRMRELLASSPPKPEWARRPEVLCSPNVPKPLHGVAPRTVLGEEWWRETRRAAYVSTDFHCVACGAAKYGALGGDWLEGHELYDTDYLTGRAVYRETVPLCNFCHSFVHDGRLKSLLDAGAVTREHYDAVMKHGHAVLAAAGLARPLPHSGPTADWADWRLVIDGREYPPLYATYADWLVAYGPATEEVDG